MSQRTATLLRLLLAACIGGLNAPLALASVTAAAHVSDERSPAPAPAAATALVAATQSGNGSGGAAAIATVDAGTGVLRVTAQGGLADPYIVAAKAVTQIQEDLTFSGGYGGTAYLDWSFDGAITLSNSRYNTPQFAAAYGQFNIYAATNLGSFSEYVTLAPAGYACGAGCVAGTSIARSGTVAIPITAYGATIQATLSAFADYGNLADFANTSKLYLRLPDGVTVTSSSGHFLEAARPIFASAVPEPRTYALLAAGLAAIGVRRRRSVRLVAGAAAG